MKERRTEREKITEKICFLLSLVGARRVCQMDPSGCSILYRWFKLVCCLLSLFKAFQHIILFWFCITQGLSWWLPPPKCSSLLYVLKVIWPTEVFSSKIPNLQLLLSVNNLLNNLLTCQIILQQKADRWFKNVSVKVQTFWLPADPLHSIKKYEAMSQVRRRYKEKLSRFM